MAGWNPGPDPFPADDFKEITDFTYLDELKFVRHANIHVDKTPASLWQLSADFRASMTVHPVNGSPYPLTIKAPRGMFTDLSSVPKLLWSLIGPIGPHLEASILHDYLYMGWTDFRTKARRQDWVFADTMFLAGMKTSKVKERTLIFGAVHSTVGWSVFKKKSYTLKERMDEWLPLLKKDHGRDDPPSTVAGSAKAASDLTADAAANSGRR